MEPLVRVQRNRDGHAHALRRGVIRHPTEIPAQFQAGLVRLHLRRIVQVQTHLEALGNEPAVLDDRVRLLVPVVQRRLDDEAVRHQFGDRHGERIAAFRNRDEVREEAVQIGVSFLLDGFRHIPGHLERLQGIQPVRELLPGDEGGAGRRIIVAEGSPGRFPFQLVVRVEVFDPEQAGIQDFLGGKAPGHLRHGHLVRIDTDEQALRVLPVAEFPVADEAVVLVQTGR